MSERLAAIVRGLTEVSIAAAATIAAAALLDLLLRRTPWPRLRAVPWLLVLVRLAMPPGIASPIAVVDTAALGARDGVAPGAASGAGIGAASSGAGIDALLVALWLAGALLLAVGAIRRHRAVRSRLLADARPDAPERWRRAAVRAARQLGLRRLPALRVVPGLPSALVLGALRPVVLLPERLPAETAARREHVLLHELAHIRRRDPLLGGVSALLQVIFWFHPLVWWARRRLALVVELCADAEVARALGAGTRAYRRTLLDIAGHASGAVPAGALGFIAQPPAILVRLRALERAPARRGGGPLASALLAALLAATVLPVRTPAHGGAESGTGTAPELLALRGAEPRPPGCLIRRYEVLGALARAQGTGSH